MTALPAANRFAALEWNVLVAVAALVVDCAGVEVDLLLRLGGSAVVAAVLLCRHLDMCWGGHAASTIGVKEFCGG